MSLRAKIEAVVYAAEEPVTLQQLIALFGAELQADLRAELQQELDITRQTQIEMAPFDASGASPANNEAAPHSIAEDAIAEDSITEDSITEDSIAEDAIAETGPALETSADDGASPSPASTPDSAEAAAKRQARLDERALREAMRRLLDALIAEYQSSDRGMEIREIAGGYRMATKPEYHDAVRSFVRSLKPPMKLTLQALETLAVVAYKQPVTAPEISEIRGVDSAGVLGSLMGRKLITTAGRKHVIGRPILYKTTKDFLLRFGLRDLNELPSIEEFEKMAGELAEGDAEFEAAQAPQAMHAGKNDPPQDAPERETIRSATDDTTTTEGA
ncbi:MAG: SMC-Scp complex subunit ScpB [Acidobacteriaceae bacterium]